MHKDLTYAINGCLFTVHNALGNIWQERVYEKAVEVELHSKGLQTCRQKAFEVFYFGKRVGHYVTDLLVEETVIIELKAVPKLVALHRAQLISYLKGFDKPLGILANFGSSSLEHETFPNALRLKTPLEDEFEYDKVKMAGKQEIKDLLFMANRIQITLGAGYFHQVYRRAFYHELKQAGVDFEIAKEIYAKFRNQRMGSREVNFFILGDLLLSIVAVNQIDEQLLSKFRNYIRYFKLKRGLIFNFRSLCLDFKYISI